MDAARDILQNNVHWVRKEGHKKINNKQNSQKDVGMAQTKLSLQHPTLSYINITT